MKQPRTSDFDPTAKDRELKSSMVDFPAIERPKQVQPADRAQEPVPPVPLVPLVPPVRDVPSSTAGRRHIKRRQPFDIYEDQDTELRRLQLEDRMRGGQGSMSAMVREAIDDYIAKVR
jgi:hypothetical protein